MNNELLNNFIEALQRAGKPKTSAYDTTATVRRIEDGIAWVHIPGGVDETPVKLTINAEAGDIVQVRVSGGTAFLVGNATAPPTDDRTANRAVAQVAETRQAVSEVDEKADEAMKKADYAGSIATATNQHFWTDDNGVHVASEAETPAATRNMLMNSLGMLFRRGANNILAILTGSSPGMVVYDGTGNADGNVIARYSADGVVLGKSAHLTLDMRSIKLADREGNDFFEAVDMRDPTTGEASIVNTFGGDGSTKVFYLSPSASAITQVRILDPSTLAWETTTAYTVNAGMTQITFDDYPADGAVIEVFFTTTSTSAKYFSFGRRPPLSDKGIYSSSIGLNCYATGPYSMATGNNSHAQGNAAHAEGNNTFANGENAHAEGYSSQASGAYSHAQNQGTKASSASQTALGKYNVEDTADTYAQIIGNGTSDAARSNAHCITWDGDEHIALDTTEDLYTAITALGWGSEVIV